jgi:hypothetical protein
MGTMRDRVVWTDSRLEDIGLEEVAMLLRAFEYDQTVEAGKYVYSAGIIQRCSSDNTPTVRTTVVSSRKMMDGWWRSFVAGSMSSWLLVPPNNSASDAYAITAVIPDKGQYGTNPYTVSHES